MPAAPLDPAFYRQPQGWGSKWPAPPWSLLGFTFDPASGTFDFSAVPGFDLGRLLYLQHVKSKVFLYSRPRPQDYYLKAADVDGVPVLPQPMTGTRLKVSVDTSAMLATDEVLATYHVDAPDNYFSLGPLPQFGIAGPRPPA